LRVGIPAFSLKKAGIPTLKFLPAPSAEKNLKGSYFGGALEKNIRGLQIWTTPLKKKTDSLNRNWPSLMISGGGGGVEIKNGTYLTDLTMGSCPYVYP